MKFIQNLERFFDYRNQMYRKHIVLRRYVQLETKQLFGRNFEIIETKRHDVCLKLEIFRAPV